MIVMDSLERNRVDTFTEIHNSNGKEARNLIFQNLYRHNQKGQPKPPHPNLSFYSDRNKPKTTRQIISPKSTDDILIYPYGSSEQGRT